MTALPEPQNVIERAIITSRCSHLQFGLPKMSEPDRPSLLKKKKTLVKVNWKVYAAAAALLHIKPTTLVSRMQKMGLEK